MTAKAQDEREFDEQVEDIQKARAKRKARRKAKGFTEELPDAVAFDDFLSYSPEHKYIFVPTGTLWPMATINGRLPWIGGVKPSTILDRNHAVEQMTWSPGEPTIIKNKLVIQGGWIERPNATVFNLYHGPKFTRSIDADKANVWIEHIRYVYPSEADHIIQWFAYRCQHPDVKIEHALVLGGTFGIGKDTLLAPILHALGAWNVQNVAPTQMLERFNGHLKSILLVVNEARDLGDINRPQFYERLKGIISSPLPLLIDEKNRHPYYIPNLCGVVFTTNHKIGGMYIAPDDRRHLVAWSVREMEDFQPDYKQYFDRIWASYYDGGLDAIATYLHTMDVSKFEPKSPPPKTAAFHEIVMASRNAEAVELGDLLDKMDRPWTVTLDDLIRKATPPPIEEVGYEGKTFYRAADERGTLAEWLKDRRNRRVIPRWMQECRYLIVKNPYSKQGLWQIGGKRQMVYGDEERIRKNTLTYNDLVNAAKRRAADDGGSAH